MELPAACCVAPTKPGKAAVAVFVPELSGPSAVIDVKDVGGSFVVLELAYCLCRMPPGCRSGPLRGPASTVASRRNPKMKH